MHNHVSALRFPFSPLQALTGCALLVVLTYMALVALVISSATLTVGFTQSVRTDEAAVASLEASYLKNVSIITHTDIAAAGYAKPVAEVFVPKTSATALR